MGRAAEKHPQDRGDGIQTMPGSRGTGRQGLHTADDGGGAVDFQGDTAVTGALPIVWEVIGEGVTGDAPPNSAWRGER